jgi:hypothetical protein
MHVQYVDGREWAGMYRNVDEEEVKDKKRVSKTEQGGKGKNWIGKREERKRSGMEKRGR